MKTITKADRAKILRLIARAMKLNAELLAIAEEVGHLVGEEAWEEGYTSDVVLSDVGGASKESRFRHLAERLELEVEE